VEPSVRLEGPTQVTPQAIATFRFVVHSNAPAQQVAAGLDVAASDGTLRVLAGEGTRLQIGEITHTAPKRNDANGEASFSFQWEAPAAPGVYTLFAAGNSVNLNGTNSGDRAAATTLTVRVEAQASTPTVTSSPTPTPTAEGPTPTSTASPTATATATATPTTGREACLGDCNGDGEVTVNEIILGVNIALELASLDSCPNFDADGDGGVAVNEVIGAVNNALNGCPQLVAEFIAQESDFECLLNSPQVRHFRVTNRLGNLEEALAVAAAAGEQPGLEFPVGTVIQLIPGEAMVKRGGNFDPEHGGWEYFSLNVSHAGTRIRSRGGAETPCYGCHSAARSFDYVCENNHGCVPLSLSQETVDLLQRSDPRCG
jgi:hypothetical protein